MPSPQDPWRLIHIHHHQVTVGWSRLMPTLPANHLPVASLSHPSQILTSVRLKRTRWMLPMFWRDFQSLPFGRGLVGSWHPRQMVPSRYQRSLLRSGIQVIKRDCFGNSKMLVSTRTLGWGPPNNMYNLIHGGIPNSHGFTLPGWWWPIWIHLISLRESISKENVWGLSITSAF